MFKEIVCIKILFAHFDHFEKNITFYSYFLYTKENLFLSNDNF